MLASETGPSKKGSRNVDVGVIRGSIFFEKRLVPLKGPYSWNFSKEKTGEILFRGVKIERIFMQLVFASPLEQLSRFF